MTFFYLKKKKLKRKQESKVALHSLPDFIQVHADTGGWRRMKNQHDMKNIGEEWPEEYFWKIIVKLKLYFKVKDKICCNIQNVIVKHSKLATLTCANVAWQTNMAWRELVQGEPRDISSFSGGAASLKDFQSFP